MVDHDKTKEELINQLKQLKQENSELKLTNNNFQKRIMNCEDIFESSPVAMFIIDETTNIEMVNLAAVKLCGGSEEEILQHRPGNALRCVHSVKDSRGCGYAPDCKTCEVRNGIEALIAKGGNINGAELEFNLIQNGAPQKVWMNIGVEPVITDGEKHWCIAMNDITKNKQIEESLRISEERFRGIFNNLQDAFFQADLSGNFTLVSPSALQMYGYDSQEELIGMPASNLYAHTAVRDQLLNELRLKGEITDFVGEGKRKDGSTFWVSMNIRFLYQNGKVSGTEGIVRDISDRKQSEQKLSESQTLLKSIIDSTSDMIWSVDAQKFGLLNWNNSFHDYFINDRGIEIGIGMAPPDLFPDGSQYVDFWKDLYRQTLDKGSLNVEYSTFSGTRVLNMGLNLLKQEGKTFGISIFAKDITQQKFAEKALKEKEEEYRTLVENLSVGIVVHDASSAIIMSNITANQILGLTDDQMKGRSAIDPNWGFLKEDLSIMPIEDYPANRILASGQPLKNYVVGVFRPDLGEMIWAICNGYPEFDPFGKIKSVVITFADITSRKLAEVEMIHAKERIEESEIRFKAISEQAMDGITLADLDGNYIFANKAFCTMTGYTEEEVLLMNVEDFRVPNAENKGVFVKVKHHGTNSSRDVQLLCKDKSIIYVDINGKKIEIENKQLILGIIRDVSDRVAKEKEIFEAKEMIEESEYRLKLATSAAGLGIWDWNLKENTMIWDDRMFELYGITRDIFPNNIDAWTNGLHPEDKQRALDECNAALNGEREFNTSFRVVHPDGTVLYLKASGSVLRDEKGKSIRMIGINRDITERRLAAKQLLIEKEKAEESDRLKSAFLANMSHEIRTPLNSIIGFSDLLLEADFEPEQKTEFIKLIRNSGNNLLAIISDIIDISKIETGQITINKKQFSVEKLISEIVEENSLKAIEKGVDLRINFADQGTSISMVSDPNRLKQILTNFVNNGIKFTEHGYVEIGFTEKNDSVQIYVKDTGIGIPKEYHEQIFDRFRQVESSHTRKYGGNGLGLAISKQLADLLGCMLRLESEPGKGSIFYLSTAKNVVY